MSPKLAPLALLSAIVACLAPGCTDSSPPPPAPPVVLGPHGGRVIELPEGAGFAEVGTENAKAPRVGATTYRVVVHVLGADRTSPASPAPSSVTVSVALPDSSPPQSLTLTPDPAGSARFVSTPGDFDAGFSGTISVGVGGKTVSRPL